MKNKFSFWFFIFPVMCFGFQVTQEKDKKLSIEADYVGIWRNHLGNQAFLLNRVDGYPYFHTLSFKFDSGIRGMIEVNPTRKDSLQFIYEGLFHWDNSGSLTSDNVFSVSTNPYENTDWTLFSTFSYQYKADLNWGEALYWRHITERYKDWFSFSCGGGLRYNDLRDRIYMVADGSNNAHVTAVNHMCGAEGALEFLITAVPLLSFGVQGKGAVYANVVRKGVCFQESDDTATIVSEKMTKTNAAYTIEAMPYMLVQMNPFYLRVAYNNILFFNTVPAPNQVWPGKSLNLVYPHKQVYIQSLIAGLGFAW